MAIWWVEKTLSRFCSKLVGLRSIVRSGRQQAAGVDPAAQVDLL
jgi:hypothetical protein